MSAVQHTPGPWIYYADLPSAEPNWHIVTTANKMRVLANVHVEPGNLVDQANARLIAAAPDLLIALKQLLSIAEDEGVVGDDTTIPACRAAIAKAVDQP